MTEFFTYDATDRTSVNDNIVVLVDSNGRRYINEDTPIPQSVLGTIVSTNQSPPINTSIGSSYIVRSIGQPLGEFAGQDGNIAYRSGKGWVFYTSRLGDNIWDISINGYRHYNGTNWPQGLGNAFLSPGTVAPAAQVFPQEIPVESVVSTPFTANSSHLGKAYLISDNASGIWATTERRNSVVYVKALGNIDPFEYIPRYYGQRIIRKDLRQGVDGIQGVVQMWVNAWVRQRTDSVFLNDYRFFGAPSDYSIQAIGSGGDSRRGYQFTTPGSGQGLPRVTHGSDIFTWQVFNRHGVTCTWQKTVTSTADQNVTFRIELRPTLTSNSRTAWLTTSDPISIPAADVQTEGSRRFYQIQQRIQFVEADLNIRRRSYLGNAVGQRPRLVMICSDKDFFPVGLPTASALGIDLHMQNYIFEG